MTWLSELINPVAFRPVRMIGDFTATVTIEETATDDLEITQHPVQDGAAITDHAYVKPVSLSIKAQWSPAYIGVPIDELYRKMRQLQASRIPIDVVTGKRIYRNMLVKSLSETTDRDTSNILNLSIQLQEVFITRLQVVTVPPRARQREPGRTGSTEQAGKKQTQSIDAAQQEPKKSALRELIGG